MTTAQQRKAHREEHKEAAIYDMKAGDSINAVAMRYGIARLTLRNWKKEAA